MISVVVLHGALPTSFNVGLWLVARFAIVANFPNYSETHVLFGGFTFVAKKLGVFFFGKTQPVIAEYYMYYKYYKYYKYHKFIRKKQF